MSRVPPVYPLRARRRRIEGHVDVELLVDGRGRVRSVTVLKAQPPGVFEHAVREALLQWRFHVPRDTQTIRLRETVRFSLEE